MNNTHFSQYIPPTAFHPVTGTFTWAAGQVAGTICMHRAAANETSVITIPIMLPSNSVALQGAKLASIEVDYEILVAEPTSITWTLNKVTRGADTAVAVVAAVTKTNTVADASAKTVDQHKQTITITTLPGLTTTNTTCCSAAWWQEPAEIPPTSSAPLPTLPSEHKDDLLVHMSGEGVMTLPASLLHPLLVTPSQEGQRKEKPCSTSQLYSLTEFPW